MNIKGDRWQVIGGREYCVPFGWDVAIFGGGVYRRERNLSRYRPDWWIVVEPAP